MVGGGVIRKFTDQVLKPEIFTDHLKEEKITDHLRKFLRSEGDKTQVYMV